MKILKISDSSCRIRIDDQDDLWALSKVCRKGVQIGMLSHRRDSTTGSTDGGRAKEAERKSMWIVLIIEHTEFHTFSESLRTTGIITEAPIDQGSHHIVPISAVIAAPTRPATISPANTGPSSLVMATPTTLRVALSILTL